MRSDTPESTTKFLSSGLFLDGAGIHQPNEGEHNVAWISFEVLPDSVHLFYQVPCFSASPSFLPFRLLLKTILE